MGTAILSACGRRQRQQHPSAGRRQEGRRRRRRPAGCDPRAGLNNGARRSGDPRVRPAAVEEAAGRRPPPLARRSLHGWPRGLGLPLASAQGGSARSVVPAPAPGSLGSLLSLLLSLLPTLPSLLRVLPLASLREGEGVQLSASPRRLAGDHPTRTCPLKASPELPENVHPEQIQEGQRDHSRV